MSLGIALGATLTAAALEKKVESKIEQSRQDAVYYTTKPAGAVSPSVKPTFRF